SAAAGPGWRNQASRWRWGSWVSCCRGTGSTSGDPGSGPGASDVGRGYAPDGFCSNGTSTRSKAVRGVAPTYERILQTGNAGLRRRFHRNVEPRSVLEVLAQPFQRAELGDAHRQLGLGFLGGHLRVLVG